MYLHLVHRPGWTVTWCSPDAWDYGGWWAAGVDTVDWPQYLYIRLLGMELSWYAQARH